MAARDRHLHDVTEELAYGAEGGMADALEVSDQRGQSCSDQTATLDRSRQRGIMDPAAVDTPTGMTAMFLNQHRDHGNVDLLDDAHLVASGTQTVPTVRADVDDIIVRRSGQQIRRHHGPKVQGVAGLPPDGTFVLSGWRSRLGRLDDIGRGRFRGSGGVFASGSELCSGVVYDGSLKLRPRDTVSRIDLRLQSVRSWHRE